MNGSGKSDMTIVPEKLSNKGYGAPCSAEMVEGRVVAKGKTFQQNKFRTQGRGRE